MDTSIITPDPAFAHIAFSISRDPASWEGWSCLRIGTMHERLTENPEGMEALESIVVSCFAGIEGKVFMSSPHMHLICKGMTIAALHDLGAQLQDMRFDGHAVFGHHAVYQFSQDAAAFVDALHSAGAVAPPDEQRAAPSFSDIRPDARILLIEDDPVTRWMVRNALKNRCVLMTASNANKAYTRYAEYRPDLVLLDIGLPDHDGRDVLDWIMRNDPGANVVMFTSDNRLDTITATLERGAKGFIAKPFLKEKLFHYIRNWT